MKAEEARKLSEASVAPEVEELLGKIFKIIEDAAKQGEFYVSVDLDYDDITLLDIICDTLKRGGYTISSRPSNIVISW